MKLKKIALCFVTLSLILAGCTAANIDLGPKKEVVSYSDKTLKIEQPIKLSLICDSSNIEVFSWEKKEMKFEIKKRIRGIGDKSVLENKLNDFNVEIIQDGDTVKLTSAYKGSIKSPADEGVDYKIYVPKKVLAILCKLDMGTLKFFDDIRCDLTADIDMANTNIKNFQGKLDFKAKMGNLRIEGGKIDKDSSVITDAGNISIKGEFNDTGSYSLETGMGNIDLMLPAESHISFENVGTVEVNEFPVVSYPARMMLNSRMGKISITKY